MYNDNLTFSSEQLEVQIGVLEEVRAVINKLKEDFMAYNEANLKPYWSTAGSIVSQAKLEGFINQDIDGFINYIDARINDLKVAHSNCVRIDEA